jgi:hypothetical protein
MNIVIQCTPEEARALFQGAELKALGAAITPTRTGTFQAEAVRKDALRFFEEIEQFTQDRAQNKAAVADKSKNLERIFADGFTLIDPRGRRLGKEQAIEDLSSQRTEFGEFDREEQMMQVFPAEQVAIRTSVISMAGEIRGNDIKGQFVDTTVLTHDGRDWRVVSSHLTPIAPEDLDRASIG